MSDLRHFFSPSVCAFFNTEIHPDRDSMPTDVVEVSEQEWKMLLHAQAHDSKRIVAGPDGHPTLIGYELTSEELAAELRRSRDFQLQQTDGLVARHRDEIDMQRPLTIPPDKFRALQLWRQELRDITSHPEFPNCTLPRRPDGV